MSYATETDLVARFGEAELTQLTDATGRGVLDSARVAQALADADAEIDGYLAGRYTLPLSAVPAMLTQVACSLARYHLYDDHAPETVRKRYEDARGWLRLVGEGRLALGVDGAGDAPTGTGGPEYYAPARVFGDDGFEGY